MLFFHDGGSRWAGLPCFGAPSVMGMVADCVAVVCRFSIAGDQWKLTSFDPYSCYWADVAARYTYCAFSRMWWKSDETASMTAALFQLPMSSAGRKSFSTHGPTHLSQADLYKFKDKLVSISR